MLRIGEIDYANVYPLFYYLKKYDDFEFIKGVPSVLNKMLRESCLDISPCSSIEFARNFEDYSIVPGISISSLKEVKSVLLFSNLPIDNLNGKKIFLTGESSTSVILFKILIKKKYKMKIHFTNNIDESEGVVLIGDKALFEYYKNNYEYKYDLGKEWFEFTGFPFVFALWIINNKNLSNKNKILTFIENLTKIKNNSKKNLAALIDHYTFKGLTSYQILDYWETINYDLTDLHIQGLLKFYKYAFEIGEIRKIPPLKFFV
jgi:chorismate dehydratase